MGAIVSGFPGIGKSHFAENCKTLKVLDADSSKFSKTSKGEKSTVFPDNYIEHIKKVVDEYDVIFVSSHKVVRDALIENEMRFTMAYPTHSLKDEYLRRYKARGNDKEFIKMMDNNWDAFITCIENQCLVSNYIDGCKYRSGNRYFEKNDSIFLRNDASA